MREVQVEVFFEGEVEVGRGEQQRKTREEEVQGAGQVHPEGEEGGPGLVGHVPAHQADAALRPKQETVAQRGHGPALPEEVKISRPE